MTNGNIVGGGFPPWSDRVWSDACPVDRFQATKITIADRFESNGHLCFADSRTFFGRITLARELCENGNPVANLFLDNVRFAWIRASEKPGPVVECQMVDSEGYGFDGRGRDYVWIVIPRRVCSCDVFLLRWRTIFAF